MTKRLHNLAPAALLLITWAAFFSRTLFLGKIYFLDDLKTIFYPLEHVFGEFQRAWSLPIWSPLFGFGHPLLAWGQLGFLTPVHVVLRLLGLHPLVLLQASILIYFGLGLIGMYWLLRRHQLHQLAAVLGAIVFVFCGFHVGHLNHVNFYVATMILPYLLLAIKRFIEQPTLRRTGIMALVAAIIPLSGQPQVALYSAIIATIYGVAMFITIIPKSDSPRYYLRFVPYVVLAATLTIGLASLAILPLIEFLPLTERASDLPTQELFEFSYPSEHAITLLFPYHFGNHDNYWGAKNFQELSSYTGIIPLLLAGAALAQWHQKRSLRITGTLLILVGVIFALGIHSPLYRLLVEQRIITSLNIPGRFVYFFDTGIAILAALGLHDILRQRSRRQSLIAAIASLGGVTLLGAITAKVLPTAVVQSPETAVLLVSSAILTAACFVAVTTKQKNICAASLVSLAATTLVIIGWNYNPLVTGHPALAPSSITDKLKSIAAQSGVPPRLYAAKSLPVSGAASATIKLTDSISPQFAVHQHFLLQENVECLRYPAEANPGADGTITISLRNQINDPVLFETTLSADQLSEHEEPRFCLPQGLQQTAPRQLMLSVEADHDSGLKLLYEPVPEPSVYFVRVSNPTPLQLEQSQKNGRLVLYQELTNIGAEDPILLMRHIQAVADTSAARWIGALSIVPYRQLIEDLFANDRYPFNGEGQHAIVHNKKIVDASGITHFTQQVPYDAESDDMLAAGYPLIEEVQLGTNKIRLYENPDAFSKAFLVNDAIFEPDTSVIRHQLSRAVYDPSTLMYVGGPKPPNNLPAPSGQPNQGTATITQYDPTEVEVTVVTPNEAWLVLTDTYTPQWKTFIDGQPTDQYFANSVWRAARVPAGEHVVSFRYRSPAVERASKATVLALVIAIGLVALPRRYTFKELKFRSKTTKAN